MATLRKRNRPLPWYVTWREPETKQQRHKAFATKREAEEFRDTVSTEPRQGTYIDRRPVPFKTFATDWLARTQTTVSPNTHALHESWRFRPPWCRSCAPTSRRSRDSPIRKIAGKMTLGTEQETKLNALARRALPAHTPEEQAPVHAPQNVRQRRLLGRKLAAQKRIRKGEEGLA